MGDDRRCRARARVLAAISGLTLATGCAQPPGDVGAAPPRAEGAGQGAGESLAPPGALIRAEMGSTVGVLLDEIPEGPMREAAAIEAAHRGPAFWTERAKRQVRLTYYRLVYRSSFYPSGAAKGPLPLPAQDALWDIHFGSLPHRQKKNGHDAVVVDYRFQTHLLSDSASPGVVEPALATVGGTFDEAFQLPLDPDLLLERTGYACIDEQGYPPYSVFEENTHYFFDHTCQAETASAPLCHVSSFPVVACVDALAAHTGVVGATLRFSRIGYRKALADRVRTGARTTETGADLSVVQGDLEREHAIFYRFFTPASCEMAEGVIGQAGWRRLLAFSASIQNDGAADIDMGNVDDPESPWVKSHVFELSDCHHHYHFSHYGTFGYGGAPGAKRAFCLEDSNRFHNDERTSLAPQHQSCVLQGVTAGWGDEYQFGIPGQWVDVTGVDTTAPHDVTFDLNPDGFLCEGTPALDPAGQLAFEPTAFTDAAGEVVSRQKCSFLAGWNGNNHGATQVRSEGGSFVNEPCTRGQIGPLRSCGFDRTATLVDCPAGDSVLLHCASAGAPQVVRVCERSEALQTGIPCTVGDGVANAIVTSAGIDLHFSCPAVRDAAAAGTGGFSIYRAPVVPGQATSPVTCVPQ